MKFEVYCDETRQDLFWSRRPNGQYLMIGSLWIPADSREMAKDRISDLRSKHNVFGEIKWKKVSPSKQDFYSDLIDMFMSFGLDMRFRCIAVDRTKFRLESFDGDDKLGFYKFYYEALHHWILDRNQYRIFCDYKLSRDRTSISTLKTMLEQANRTSTIEAVQSLPSQEVVLLQLCDVLLGAVSARMNEADLLGRGKSVVEHLERRLNRERLGPTTATERKFNVLRVRQNGGW